MPDRRIISHRFTAAARRTSVATSIAVVIASSVAWAGHASSGKADFNHYCAECHGSNGTGCGDDRKILMDPPAADLTQLSKKNHGAFPFDEIVKIVDGRKTNPSHNRTKMPFWGMTLQKPSEEFTPASNAEVRRRIEAIVRYIETLQAK
jgi:mono/diheme cytochrome c family protein